MCTLIFYYRALKRHQGRDRGSLCLRFIHRRKSVSISTGYVLYKEEWDATLCQVVPVDPQNKRSPYLLSVRNSLSDISSLFLKIVFQLKEQGSYSVYEVARSYRSYSKPESLSSYSRALAGRLIENGRSRTARAYISTLRSIVHFNKGHDLSLGDLSPDLIKRYETYLKDRGKSLNTISFYMRNLRAIYNKSLSENLHRVQCRNLFSDVYTGVDHTKKRALSLEEIGKLRDADICETSSLIYRQLSRSKRYFFFCFYARGMSFVDLAYLRKSNISKGVLSYYRKKTGQFIEVKLTDELTSIIDSFSHETRFSPYVFPIILDESKGHRRQYENGLHSYNRNLKKLGLYCGINKPLSSHVARHSWATIAKYEQLPLSVISEGLGHSNEKTTYIYLASLERSFLDQANEQISNAIQRVSKLSTTFARYW